jgi:methionyl-tRNA formyltransferase
MEEMGRLRVAFFGMTGPLSLGALGAIAAEHTVAAVVQPRVRRTEGGGVTRLVGGLARAIGLDRPGSLGALQRAYRFPIWEARSGADPEIADRLHALRPDLICIAGYPWILPPEFLTGPPLGAINLHAALLPRHRGPLPLFWIYYHDDRETGVTAHCATPEADAGPILGQASFPLERGFPVDQLNRLNGGHGADLLRGVLRDLAAGRAAPRPQDEALVTLAPRVRPGTAMVDFHGWDVERVWHFMAGLFPRFREPLTVEDGTPAHYRGVRGYWRESHRHPPGTVLPSAEGWNLYCLGGHIQLAARA